MPDMPMTCAAGIAGGCGVWGVTGGGGQGESRVMMRMGGRHATLPRNAHTAATASRVAPHLCHQVGHVAAAHDEGNLVGGGIIRGGPAAPAAAAVAVGGRRLLESLEQQGAAQRDAHTNEQRPQRQDAEAQQDGCGSGPGSDGWEGA